MLRTRRLIWCVCWACSTALLVPTLVCAQPDDNLGPIPSGRAPAPRADGESDRLTRLAQRKVAELESGAPRPERRQATDFDEDRPLGRAPADTGATPPGDTPDEQLSSGPSWLLNTATALGAVLGLILLLRLLYARITGRAMASGHHPAVEVLARVAVAPRNHVLLVRLGQRILVLGDSAQGLTNLATIDDADEIAGLLKSVAAGRPNSISRGFSQLLGRFNHEYPDDGLGTAAGLDRGEQRTDRARDEVSGLLSRVRALSRGTAP